MRWSEGRANSHHHGVSRCVLGILVVVHLLAVFDSFFDLLHPSFLLFRLAKRCEVVRLLEVQRERNERERGIGLHQHE